MVSSPYPYLQSHFDSQKVNSYRNLKHRVQKASESLDAFKIYLVELSKDLKNLSPDQQTCLNYLTTDFLFQAGDADMNQSKDSAQATHDDSKPQDSQYLVHRDASAEVKNGSKKHIKDWNILQAKPINVRLMSES